MKYVLGFFSFEWLRIVDFIAPLLMRLFLAPLFWVAGVKHLGLFSSPDFVFWNPLTWTNSAAFAVSVTELNNTAITSMSSDTILLVVGVLEILAAILLILGFAVRWITLAMLAVVVVLATIAAGDVGIIASLKQLVMSHGYTTMANNPMEVYLTYFIMLVALFFMGAGRWISLDWFVYRSTAKKVQGNLYAEDPFEIDATDEAGIRSY